MKKTKRVLLMGILFIWGLTGCQVKREIAENGNTKEQPGLEVLPEQLRNVVEKDGVFYDVEQNKNATMSTYQLTDMEEKLVPAQWKDYIVADVDMDGERELIVHINQAENPDFSQEGVRILDLQFDKVYCYSYDYQQVIRVYKDGGLEESNGELSNCIYGVEYDGEKSERIRICESVQESEQKKYFVGALEVKEKEYNQFITKYNEENCLKWSNDFLLGE